ncbi:MAG: hypothetical protein DRP71_06215 [Verrucomicrobia bacterium]|nr:MAG: hypothetical protein DRP71_06215 [Verrucomicrobiota bacterium]
MARKNRIETADGLYHVLNRGNYRSVIFESEGTKVAFGEVLWEGCERFGWDLFAFVLMSNHFHPCIATPKGNLSQSMRSNGVIA